MKWLKHMWVWILAKRDDDSGPREFNWTDFRKWLRGAVWVGLSAGLTTLVNNLASLGLSPEAVAVATMALTWLIDAITKYAKDNKVKEN